MGEFDLDAIILETVRRQTGIDAAGPKSRLENDLGLTEIGRKSLFAFMAEAFSARGHNLPARGFYQSNFLRCATIGEVQRALRDALTGTRKNPQRTTSAAPTPTPASPAPGPSPAHRPAATQ